MSGHVYSDERYGVIERKWFGLPRKYGGEGGGTAFTIASGTTKTAMTRFYPKGPIRVLKMGAFVVATLASAANGANSVRRARLPIKFYHSAPGGAARANELGTVHLTVGATGRTARYGIASVAKDTSVAAGRYINIYLATANSHKGTLATGGGTILRTGTFACFVDWVRTYDPNRWDTGGQG